ncbi:unnamed protein product [Coregonus sp. 'balchen']|nr:unnamed protein product [Coregonus sp. 'balchen']
MSEPKSMESLGSGCGVPAQRSSQLGPEMVSVKLEDCSQTLELNVIVKEEWEEREVKEVDEKAVKEEVEEERAVKEEVEERGVKEEEENRDVSTPDLEEEEEEVDSISDPGKFRRELQPRFRQRSQYHSIRKP